MQRRTFIKRTIQGGALFYGTQFPFEALAQSKKHLTILHTNDVHSHLEPFPMDGGKYQGLGGVVHREQMINAIRSEYDNHLLLDAGDMFQGTPYYNLFRGEAEIKMMNALKYNAATLGNHDFDNGIEELALRVTEANFSILNCNYDFTNTPLEGKVAPYQIFRRQGLRIGVLGVGIALDGLVLPSLYGGVQYKDPIQYANQTAYHLKKIKKCDYVICLSHLGFDYKDKKVSDKILASESENIDLIIGGHTHTFLENAISVTNKKNKPVLINQVGWAGIKLGRIDINFEHTKPKIWSKNSTVKKCK